MNRLTHGAGSATTPGSSPTATALVESRMLRRSIDMVIQQSRIGLVTVFSLVLALGGLFVPAAGWPHYLAWSLPVLAGFALRQYWFERLRRHSGQVNGLQLTMITSISAFTGWLVMLCMPVFGPHLPEHHVVFLGGLMLAWISAAVAVLGVQPKVYGVYLVACLLTVMLALWSRSSGSEWGVMALAMVFGGLIMYRLAVGIRSLIRESVAEGVQSEALARQLDQALDEQRLSFETRSRFLAAASHDLKQPVQALTLLVSVLKRSTSEDRRQQVVAEIDQATQSIDSMFSSLMDMARIDAGSLQAHKKAVELLPLLRNVLTAFPQRCEQKDLQFSLEASGTPVVFSDPLLLQRVLGNLLENALKFTQQGDISVSVSPLRNGIEIAITDTGIGIPADELPRLFEAFVRGQAAQALGVPGLGLGLAIARHMADLMDADLTIRSTRGQGTTASIWLPLAHNLEAVAIPAATQPSLPGEHVLLLEDDTLLRAAMTQWLKEAGARVTGAAHGDALWAQLDGVPTPTMVVLDFNLGPEHDNGAEVLVRLRQRFPLLPAVMVTGEASDVLAPPGVTVLRKPVSAETLAKALNGQSRPAST